MTSIKLGTRGSPLALWQANRVAEELKKAWPDLSVEIIPIKTTGDRIQDRSLSEVGGKGLFVKEIEEALLASQIDIAVHSMKDMPAELPEGLSIAAVLKREEYRDALVSRTGKFADLKQGALVGTSSLRRRAEASRHRADLKFADCRGNVETRLRKLENGDYDAIVLSAAGLIRLGLADRVTEYLDWTPAVGQGVIGIECRSDDRAVLDWLKPLHHAPTFTALCAERSFMRVLEGNCQVAIGAFADLASDGQLDISGFFVDPKTLQLKSGRVKGAPENPELLGLQLADQIK